MNVGNAHGLLHVSLKLGLGFGGGAAVKRCDESWKCSRIAACIMKLGFGGGVAVKRCDET